MTMIDVLKFVGEGIVKPEDITLTCKRKADSDETKENETFLYPDEDNNSILNFTKLNNLVSPPAKRTRLSDVTSLNMSVKSMRRMSRFMTADAISILTTPTIHKVKKNVSGLRFDAESTPTSILKVKLCSFVIVPVNYILFHTYYLILFYSITNNKNNNNNNR